MGVRIRIASVIVCLATQGVAAALVGTPVHAQEIRGQIVDSVSGVPVARGFAVLVDEQDREVVRVLTDQLGRFRLFLPSQLSGRFRVRSERIGYRVAVTSWFDQMPLDSVDLTIRASRVPTAIPTLTVQSSTPCQAARDLDEHVATALDEAWKALAATTWTAARHRYRVLSNLYVRELDARNRATLGENQELSERYAHSLVASRGPEELRREGYVVVDDSGVTYHAPDLRALRDEAFLTTHCFRPVAAGDSTGELIGLAFEPIPNRNLPDIKGVLWLEKRSWELQFLEYRYVNLPFELRTLDDDDTGIGRVDFSSLSSGEWIVARWQITTPTGFREERRSPFDRTLTRTITRLRQTGGEVLAVVDTQGLDLYHAELAEVVGSVVQDDGSELRPSPGVKVSVDGTWFAATTDAAGEFRLAVPLNGRHRLALSHSGPAPEPQVVTFVRGGTVSVRLVVPHADVVTRIGGMMVERSTDTPLKGASAILLSDDEQAVVRSETDDNGLFVLIVPAPGRYSVVGQAIGYAPDTSLSVELRAGQSLNLTLALDRAAVVLDPVTVYGERAAAYLRDVGFFQRQREGIGVFLDRIAIEKRAASDVGNVLRGIAGVRVDSRGAVRLRGTPSLLRTCSAPLVFVDGVRIHANEPQPGAPTAGAWYRQPAEQIEAIEVYRGPSELPAQYNTGADAACGAILIWTRRHG